MSSLAPAVVVFEKSPRWESELKRRLAGPRLLVRPCRSAADVLALCRQISGSVVVVDFAAGAAEGLRLLESLSRRKLPASAVVIASGDNDELEWLARELGAAAFVSELIGGDLLAEICRRLLPPETQPGPTPPAPHTAPARIRKRPLH